MRVCMRVGAWVRSHFAEVSKIVQDAPGAKEHKHQSDHHKRNTSDHHKSSTTTGAGAQPQERERDQSERTSKHLHTRV